MQARGKGKLFNLNYSDRVKSRQAGKFYYSEIRYDSPHLRRRSSPERLSPYVEIFRN